MMLYILNKATGQTTVSTLRHELTENEALVYHYESILMKPVYEKGTPLHMHRGNVAHPDDDLQ